MRLSIGSLSSGRALILLAPQSEEAGSSAHAIGDPGVHTRVLAQMQRFRGQVYVAEGNLEASDLSPDGRHVQPADEKSWHLLTIDEQGAVVACGRVLVHRPGARFADLSISHCALARSRGWGYLLERAVEEQIRLARFRGRHFAEIGGWAVARNLRCTTEAVRLVLAGYALGEMLGGIAGVSTANTGHHSSSILRRIGGTPLSIGEVPFPSFYEPQYRAELELLCLDSFWPNPVYSRYVRQCRAELETATTIFSSPSKNSCEQYASRHVRVQTVDSTKRQVRPQILSV